MDALLIAHANPSQRRGNDAGDLRPTPRSEPNSDTRFSRHVPAAKQNPKPYGPRSEDREPTDVAMTGDINPPAPAPVPVAPTWTVDLLAGPWLTNDGELDTAIAPLTTLTTLPLLPDDGSQSLIIDDEAALTIIDNSQTVADQEKTMPIMAEAAPAPSLDVMTAAMPAPVSHGEELMPLKQQAGPNPESESPLLALGDDEGAPAPGPLLSLSDSMTMDTMADHSTVKRNDQPAQALVEAVNAQQDEEGPVRNGDGMDIVRPVAERSAGGGERVSAPPPVPTPETAPDRALAQQVSRAIIQQTADGQRVMQLRLTPPELGTVRIELVEHRGVLQIRLGAEDDGVRAALERALPGLRQDMRSANAPIAGLELVDQHLEFFQHHHGHGDAQSPDDHDRPGHGNNGQRFSLEALPEDQQAPRRHTPDLHVRISDDAVDALA